MQGSSKTAGRYPGRYTTRRRAVLRRWQGINCCNVTITPLEALARDVTPASLHCSGL
jgi:hypothetical protein